MDCVNWKKIKKEYIAGGTSYRKLAEKYQVSFSTLRKKAANEKWTELRNKARAKSDTKIVENVSDKESKVEIKIIDVADKLLTKLISSIEVYRVMDGQSMKQYTSALKDLKDIKGFKSEMDLREQEARIANLERQAKADENNDKPCGVVLIPAVLEELTPPADPPPDTPADEEGVVDE